ncbi:P6 [Emaravirus idaeobati]|uniref:p6 n=1 Tax=Emaravirus idaeobati TaxID=1980431 RepID=A0A0K1LHJ7_9VIRU|nr:P6 [Emaravirus idaeobati]AKU41976.1 P6 [Emaravirus idaeobati]
MSVFSKVIIEVWYELFENLIGYIDRDDYEDMKKMRKLLLDNGEIDPEVVSSIKSVSKFNKIVYLCTQIVDYDSCIYNKFKKHLEMFDIKMMKKDFNLRYRNKAVLSRMIAESIDLNKEDIDMTLWDEKLTIISKKLRDYSYKTEIDLMATCTEYMKIINKLQETLDAVSGAINNHNDSFNSPLWKVNI